jgi:hypothetical protein|eukprot:COSAG01_NODE_1419_length_10368_cov_131.656344_10_plen_72_part_00
MSVTSDHERDDMAHLRGAVTPGQPSLYHGAGVQGPCGACVAKYTNQGRDSGSACTRRSHWMVRLPSSDVLR